MSTASAIPVSSVLGPQPAASARKNLRAVFFVWVVESVVAWVLATPWATFFSSVWGSHPDGDRALWWNPSHIEFSEMIHRHGDALLALVNATLVGLAVYFVLGVFLQGALLACLSDGPTAPTLRTRRMFGRGAELFAPLAFLRVASIVLVAVTISVVAVLPASMLSSRLAQVTPARAFAIEAIPVVVAALLSVYILSAIDLARATVACKRIGGFRALLLAARAPSRVVRLVGSSLPRWVASAGLIGFGAVYTSRVSSVLAILVAHQFLGFCRMLLRASVLSRAVRIACERDPAWGERLGDADHEAPLIEPSR